MKYIDVNSLDELPELPQDQRYFDTIGGSKNFRCFIAPKDYPRNIFLLENEHLLDKCLSPIYKNNGITVRQDTSCPLPGFYIVAPDKHYKSLDEIPIIDYIRLMFIIYNIRKGLRSIMHIDYAYLLYEEKENPSCNVHFWILPITDIKKYPRMYKFDIKQYMDTFELKNNHGKIINTNMKMISYLESEKIIEKDNRILTDFMFLLNDESNKSNLMGY